MSAEHKLNSPDKLKSIIRSWITKNTLEFLPWMSISKQRNKFTFLQIGIFFNYYTLQYFILLELNKDFEKCSQRWKNCTVEVGIQIYFKQKWFCSKKLCCRLLYKLQKTETNEYKFEIKRKKNKNGNNVIQTLNNHKTIVMSSQICCLICN